MPDKDIVHPNLQYKYQKPYKMICEGEKDYEFLGRLVANGLKRDIKEYGNGPIQFLEQVAEQIKNLPPGKLFSQLVNWDSEFKKMEQYGQQINADQRGMSLAMDVSKQAFIKFQYFGEASSFEQLLDGFFHRIYSANFEERVPLSRYYLNASHDTISDALSNMRFYIRQHISGFASQTAQTKKIGKLWRHKRSNTKSSTQILLDLDISV